MGADNHPTVTPKKDSHSVQDAVDALEESPAFRNVAQSGVKTADAYAILQDDYDTVKHTPEWVTIENVYAVGGVTGIWFKIDD